MANGQQDEAAIARQYAGKSEADIAAEFGQKKPPLSQADFNQRQEEGYRSAYGKERERGGLVLTDADVMNLGLGGLGAGKAIATQGVKAIPRLATALLGSAAGSTAGGYIGNKLGGETGAEYGSTIGGLAGGFFGGMRKPSLAVPESVEAQPRLFPKKQPLDIPGATSSASPKWQGPMEGPKGAPSPFPTVQPKPKTSLAVPRADEPLVLSPEEWASKDRLMAITTRQASERGMQYAGGARTAGPNKPQNRLFPVRQAPVAQLGSDVQSSQVFQPGQPDPLQGNPTPFGGMPKLRPEVQQMTTAGKAAESPEWVAQQKSLDLERLRNLQRNGTPEEQAYANQILKDMQ